MWFLATFISKDCGLNLFVLIVLTSIICFLLDTMLGSIRETIISVQNELSSGVEKLRMNVSPSVSVQQRCISEAVEDIVKTSTGGELLLKFQLSLEEMHEVADEGARLANLCSTRMGRAQQMCKERADAVMSIDSFLRNSAEMEKSIKDLNRQVDKLVRFCNQTEQAMTHLEGLQAIVETEDQVEVLRGQAKTATTIIQMETGPAVLNKPTVRPGDEARSKQEEVMLEEFLSTEQH